MPHVKLANDVTIADLTSGMDDPIGYVRGVLENMAACKNLHRMTWLPADRDAAASSLTTTTDINPMMKRP